MNQENQTILTTHATEYALSKFVKYMIWWGQRRQTLKVSKGSSRDNDPDCEVDIHSSIKEEERQRFISKKKYKHVKRILKNETGKMNPIEKQKSSSINSLRGISIGTRWVSWVRPHGGANYKQATIYHVDLPSGNFPRWGSYNFEIIKEKNRRNLRLWS